MKRAFVVIPLLNLAAAAPALGADPAKFHSETRAEADEKGNVDREVRSRATNADGTVVKQEFEEESGIGRSGERRATLTTKTTRDPEGLGNKTTEETETTATYDPRGGLEKKSRYDSVDSAGTGHRVTSDTRTDLHDDGTRRTRMVDEEIHDPKGLRNKHTVKKTTTVDRRANGKAVVTTKKEVDGKTVAEQTREIPE
jgi:hypothetical protein